MTKSIFIKVIHKWKLFFLFMLLVCLKTTAQNIDSLKIALQKAKDDTSRCAILSALIQSEPSEEVWPKYNDQLFTIADKNLKTDIKDKKTRELYQKYLANALNDKAYILNNLGDVQLALEYYHQSMKINENLKNGAGMAISFTDLGTIYYDQNDLPKAKEYFEKALKIQLEIGDDLNLANTYNNLGLTYKTMRDYRSALVYYNKSIGVHKKASNKASEAITYANIGSVYLHLKDEEKALSYYKMALAMQESIDDKDGVSATLINLADLLIKQGHHAEAMPYATRAMALSKTMGYPDNIAASAFLLKKIYKEKKDVVKELEMFELYILMHDSINNQQNRTSSMRSQVRYEYEKRAAADSVKVAEEKKITEAQLKQEKTQRFALYSGLVLVALFAAFMFNRFRVTQKQKDIISHQKEEVELQRHEAEYQKELVQEKAAELSARQKEIIDSINYAKRLQNAILPPTDYIKKHLADNFVYYKPKDIVAGDFYWMHITNDKKVFIAAADSTGHGVPGAMVSIVCSNALDKAVKEFGLTDSGKILDKTRELVLETFSKSGEEIKDGMDISFLCIDKQQQKISWSGANNHLLLIKKLDGKPVLEEIKGDKQPIGNSDHNKHFTTHHIAFEKDMLCYLLTDGYADQFGGAKGKKFKYKQLKEVLIANCNLDLDKQKEVLNDHFQKWKGNLEQVDDVTIIGIKLS